MGDLLLDSLTALFTDGYAVAMPIRRRAVRAFRSDDLTVEEGLRWLWLASSEAAKLWDDASWSVLLALHGDIARAAGALSVLRSRSTRGRLRTSSPASSTLPRRWSQSSTRCSKQPARPSRPTPPWHSPPGADASSRRPHRNHAGRCPRAR
jgi:hypothetical protein